MRPFFFSDLDGNRDGKVDVANAAFSSLWVLKNGQMLTLGEAGTFAKIDGSTGAMDDVGFKVDAARTLDLAEVAISEAITALPELQGFGNVHSLHTAMALDNGRRMCRNNSFVHHAFFLMLLLGCIFISIQNAIAGDSLTSKSNDFRENRIVPILIRANLCTSRQDCRNKEILLCSSSSTATSCDFYGITDEKIMKEIMVEIMYGNTLIKSVFFYRNTKKNTSFFENSIMMYSDKLTGDK